MSNKFLILNGPLEQFDLYLTYTFGSTIYSNIWLKALTTANLIYIILIIFILSFILTQIGEVLTENRFLFSIKNKRCNVGYLRFLR